MSKKRFCLRLSYTKAVTPQQHVMRGLDCEGLGRPTLVFGFLKSGTLRKLGFSDPHVHKDSRFFTSLPMIEFSICINKTEKCFFVVFRIS